MSRPDRVRGPTVIEERDVPALNRLFSEAFTERYRRDGLMGVRVPPLNPAVWRYAIRNAGAGAMAWHDRQGELVAFNLAHQSGTEGWMGPLAVRPDRQGEGIGRVIVETAVGRLREAGVATLGLETMPRTIENIGFYSRLGFVPGHLTVTFSGPVPKRVPASAGCLLGEAEPEARRELIAACRQRLGRSAPGYDYEREIQLSIDLELGDTVVITRQGAVAGFGLWHSAPLAEGRGTEELRLLKAFAADTEVFLEIVQAAERAAARRRIGQVAVRCQSRFVAAYAALVERGYEVRWTDLRMTLSDLPEPRLAEDEVLLSNWEI